MLGCDGKWVIHPSQVELANAIFTPADEEIAARRRVLAAMADAQQSGMGAVTLDGRMIDVASVRQAEAIVRKADAIATPRRGSATRGPIRDGKRCGRSSISRSRSPSSKARSTSSAI